jgi:glycosyltransferase involved in cell wall biosynthesis
MMPPGTDGSASVRAGDRPTDETSSGLPSISVVTPSLNKAEFIAETIESVRDQDYQPLEHIIVDGGSSDGTADIVQRYASLPHLRWISEPDDSQCDAINKGVRLATGHVVAWLNADDYYAPGALRAIGAAFARHPDAGVVYGSGAQVDREGKLIRLIPTRPFDRRRLRHVFFVIQPTMFIRRDLFLAVGGVTPSTRWVMDWELMLKLAGSAPVYAIPDKIASMRIYQGTLTSMGGWEIMREIARIGRAYNGPFDRNWVSLLIRERLKNRSERVRSRTDWLMNLVLGPKGYWVRGWPAADRRRRG